MTRVIEAVPFLRSDSHPKGSAWLITDDDLLARGVAQIALGQWDHLEMILRGQPWSEPQPGYARTGAIRTLSAPPGSPDWMVWHRDGWLFQAISWIAAVEANQGPARPPHIGHAEKGFDGLQLLLSRDGERAKRLIIFEDKATENPRDTVRDDVWPSLTLLEAGERDHELRAELASLLLQVPDVDRVQAVDRVLRNSIHRSYRISVTIGTSHASKPGIKRLFSGYDSIVSGPRRRRRAHVLELTDMRPWMAQIADRAIAAIEEMH